MSAAGRFPQPAGTAVTSSRKAEKNRSVEVQDLLRRARSKTQQATYRNRLGRSSATAAYSPTQYPKGIEQQPRRPNSPHPSAAIQDVHDQRHDELRTNSPFQEPASRRQARLPTASQAYSKETSHIPYLSDDEPEQKLSQQKANRNIQESQKRKEQPKEGNHEAVDGEVKTRRKRKRKHPRRAPVEGLPLVKRIETIPSSQQAMQLPGSLAVDVDAIEPHTSLEFKKRPKANEAGNRKPLSKLRQALKLPVRDTIDLSGFKVPPRPQTPDTRRYSNWSPGDGFDGIPCSVPAAFQKRTRQGRRSDSFKKSNLRLDSPLTFKAVGKKSRNAQRMRDIECFQRPDASNLQATATKARCLLDTAERPSVLAEAQAGLVEDEQQPLENTSYKSRKGSESRESVNDTPNRLEACQIDRALAEELNGRKSSQEATILAEEALPFHAESHNSISDVPLGTASRSHNAEKAAQAGLAPAPLFFPNHTYSHPPSSALPDIPIRDFTNTSGLSLPGARKLDGLFPYYACVHPPSLALREKGGYHTGETGGDAEERAEKKPETGQPRPGGTANSEGNGKPPSEQHECQASTSDEQDKELGSERCDSEQNASGMEDEERRSEQHESEDTTSDEETKEPKTEPVSIDEHEEPNPEQSTSEDIASDEVDPEQRQSNNEDEDMLLEEAEAQDPRSGIASDEPETYTKIHPPFPSNSPRPASTRTTYFTQLSSPSKPSPTLPRRKSHAVPDLPTQKTDVPEEYEKEEEGVGVSQRLEKRISRLPFRPRPRSNASYT